MERLDASVVRVVSLFRCQRNLQLDQSFHRMLRLDDGLWLVTVSCFYYSALTKLEYVSHIAYADNKGIIIKCDLSLQTTLSHWLRPGMPCRRSCLTLTDSVLECFARNAHNSRVEQY